MFGRPWNIANHDLGKLKYDYFKEIKHYQSSAFLEHPFTTSWKIKSNLHKFKHFHFCISVFDVGSKHSSIYNWVTLQAFYFNLFKVVQIPTNIEHFLTKTIQNYQCIDQNIFKLWIFSPNFASRSTERVAKCIFYRFSSEMNLQCVQLCNVYNM